MAYENRNLRAHLNPTGNLTDPLLLPDVIDHDGNILNTLSTKRILNSVSAVDIGDSPNSNTGDPLRLAFIKLNNFMEASYWTSDSVDSEIHQIRRRLPLASSTAPLDPEEGAFWWNPDTNELSIFSYNFTGYATSTGEDGWVVVVKGAVNPEGTAATLTWQFNTDGGTF